MTSAYASGVTFLHTADWQLGKPFGSIEDEEKRVLLRQQRIAMIDRIGEAAREHGARFVLVAGDLFDSASASRSTVADACTKIGALKMPVLVIPGNHDHGGPGSIWQQPFFLTERREHAPNLHVLLEPTPFELEEAVVFPCPLKRRHEMIDPTAWLGSSFENIERFGNKPRIVLAHGTVQGFSAAGDEDDDCRPGLPNYIDLSRIPPDVFDYVALGDWHGMKEMTPFAWYSGTPELDRFPKGPDHAPGHVLIVTAKRQAPPSVSPVRTAHIGWHEETFALHGDADLDDFDRQLGSRFAGRTSQDLLHLRLCGSLGLEGMHRLEQKLESWRAHLLNLKLVNELHIAPSADELDQLSQRSSDPLIQRVAGQLLDRAQGDSEQSQIASIALRELYLLCRTL